MSMELTVSEVATLLGLSPRAVGARVARGDLPGIKRGTRSRPGSMPSGGCD